MNKSGPIIIIDDDKDDQKILTDIFNDLKIKNSLLFFNDGFEAIEYLNANETNPFLIFSDVNMPKISGFELRAEIQNTQKLKNKNIPFLVFTTAASSKTVDDAYTMPVQGFFIKPSSYKELETVIKSIVEYWQICIASNEYH
ncbi:MAG: response regulator [Bacteroidia bacterium]|nr:response regulator [Bacteroidia bacterium]